MKFTPAVAALCLAPLALRAQASLHGRVRADSVPLAGATVEVVGRASTRTTAAGEFTLSGLSAGRATVLVRAIGFRTDSAVVDIVAGAPVMRDFRLERIAPAQPLDTAKVTTRAARPGFAPPAFYDRKQQGIGRQYDRSDLEKWDNGTTSMFLSTIPGSRVATGGNQAALVTTRAVSSTRCAFCRESPESLVTPADLSRGFRPACYMDVYLNGMLVYQYGQTPPQPIFDLNSIPPNHMEAFEVYTSASQIPAQYNRTSSGCGIALIWTRISPPKP